MFSFIFHFLGECCKKWQICDFDTRQFQVDFIWVFLDVSQWSVSSLGFSEPKISNRNYKWYIREKKETIFTHDF